MRNSQRNPVRETECFVAIIYGESSVSADYFPSGKATTGSSYREYVDMFFGAGESKSKIWELVSWYINLQIAKLEIRNVYKSIIKY